MSIGRWITLVAVTAATLGAAAPASAQISDPQMKIEVEQQLRSSDFGRRLVVSVQDHVVRLSGSVPTLWVKRDVIKRAFKVKGVESVVSDMMISQAESDAALAAEVGKRVRTYSHYTVYDDLNGSVRNGVVTLTGKVTSSTVDKAAELDDLIAKVRGVRDIENKIQTLAVNPMDDRLRVAIVNAIYGDPGFQIYSLADPPVHVLVDHGNVTLVGVVASEIDRRKAYANARGVPGAFGVENQLRIPSELGAR
jgi:hyperosmotically inducible protein